MSSNVDEAASATEEKQTIEQTGEVEAPEPVATTAESTDRVSGVDATDEADTKGEADAKGAVDTKDGSDAKQEHEEFVEDGRADMALDFVVEVLTTMGMDCTVDLMENNATDPPTDIRIEVTGRDAGQIVGKKGQTLAALQFLTNRVVNRPSKQRRHILIDSDGYRSRRESALSTMAQRLGKQAVAEGKIITFEPMSAQDRRVVHLALAKFPGLVTKSEGKGATRRVQIIPVRDE